MALPELNTARYEMVIPSTGDTISFRPYLVKEEKILMMAMESNDNKVIMKATADVIKSCVNDELDIDELAMFDIETIFLELRSKSVGETVDLKIKCEDEECDVVNDIVINFDDIERPVVTDEINKIMITDEVGVVMKYPSMKYMEKLTDVGDTDAEQSMNMIMSSIDVIFDKDEVYPVEDETKENLQKFVDSLSTVQFMRLSDFFRDMPSLKHDVEFKCTCGKEQKQELRGLSSFFT